MATGVTAATGACESSRVFVARIMTGVSYVTLAVPRLIPVEVIEGLLTALRHRSCITMMRIVPVIDVAVEAMLTVKPRSSSNEHPAGEPIGAVIPVGSTRVRVVVEVPVRTQRRSDCN